MLALLVLTSNIEVGEQGNLDNFKLNQQDASKKNILCTVYIVFGEKNLLLPLLQRMEKLFFIVNKHFIVKE